MLAILAAARFAHFTAAALLFGLLAFPFYAPVPGEAGRNPPRLIRRLAAAALVTDLLVLAVSAVNMTGELGTLLDPATLWDIAVGTGFGRVWALRAILGVGLVALSLRTPPKDSSKDGLFACAAALFLIGVAYSGHSRSDEGWLGMGHVFADAVHLMAAGAWVGGLLALILLIPRLIALGRQAYAARVVHQFSEMGYAAVGAIVFTGLIKGLLLVGAPITLITTDYGRVLVVKLLLFAGMGALALSNRLWISPALDTRPDEFGLWLGRLKRQVILELGLGVLVLAAVGLLGALPPAITD